MGGKNFGCEIRACQQKWGATFHCWHCPGRRAAQQACEEISSCAGPAENQEKLRWVHLAFVLVCRPANGSTHPVVLASTRTSLQAI